MKSIDSQIANEDIPYIHNQVEKSVLPTPAICLGGEFMKIATPLVSQTNILPETFDKKLLEGDSVQACH